ncbi:translation initiation inhibitor YjgF [Gluconacetobacter johannae DSM 13595]|nr:translation initiation inhibitor YjgF [Gluconacetobacter johannae DSM 13595]
MTAGPPPHVPPPVAALILAAGRSSRTAPRHKLLAPDAGGVPMIARIVRAACASTAAPVIVVLGHRAAEIRAAILRHADHPGLVFTLAEDHAHGLSASLRAGLAAAGPHAPSGVLVCLGDMPLIDTPLIDRLVARHRQDRAPATVPVHDGRIGHPVLWDRSVFPALMALEGDVGGRALIRAHAGRLATVPADAAIHADFDTPDRLDRFGALGASQGDRPVDPPRPGVGEEGARPGRPPSPRTGPMSKIIRTEPNAILSKVVEYHGFLFTQGFVARDLTGDATAQTRDILAQIDEALELHGTDKTRLLQAQIWLKDIADRDALNGVWSAWLPKDGAPARACVQAVLANPAMLVEIMIICTK